MARISGIDIPREKRVIASLRYIHGIGAKRAEDICNDLEINPDTRVNNLTNDEIAKIIDYQGKELCILKAPEDGMFFGLRALPNVTIGDWCCFYAIIEGEW